MFVAEELTVNTGSAAAQARFENLVHGDWLAGVSEAAYDGSVTGLRKVGPAGRVAGKLVRVSFLDPVYRGDVMMVGMRWEATGAAGALSRCWTPISPSPPQGTTRRGWRWRVPTGRRWGAWVPRLTGL